MPAKLSLITLYREALHKPVPENAGSDDSPELSMDYFDTLTAKNFTDVTKDSMKDFLGLNIDEEFDQNRVAMQSIPLYCPASVYDTYQKKTEREQKKRRKYPGLYQDPFQEKEMPVSGQDQKIFLPYLSVIEVFITPEIMARLDMKAVCEQHSGDCFDTEDREALRIYNAFYRDLHILMENFLNNENNIGPDERFIYCIYESLSVGDFSLVIRSSRPETAFKVTTLLRKRSCNLEYSDPKMKAENDPDSLVLYKTFTIFSLTEKLAEAAVIREDEEEYARNPWDAGESCRYVLRGVLTNRYWNTFKKNGEKNGPDGGAARGAGVRDILNAPDLMPYIRRLHGRYDFTLTLSEQAFRAIHPVLLRYKLDRDIKPQLTGDTADIRMFLEDYPLDPAEKTICETIILYICRGYVSYINERYLLSLNTSGIEVQKFNGNICLKPVKGRMAFTNDCIDAEIRKLKSRLWKTSRVTLQLNTSGSSLMYSMRLLEKLVSICSSVNGISDARFYSLVICKQIEAVLNCFDEYIEHIEITNDLTVVRHLDRDMKVAIESINSFAQFILESTMQSFQTPLYSLETHVSVEKMLTGYSWFLQSILDWFDHSVNFAKIKGSTQKYLALMVPDRFDGELSTRSIFFKMNNRNRAARKKLLTVYCPSFTELTDFTGAFGTLFHELAHYMRYKSRYDRNRMILEYSSWLLFDQTVDEIVSDFQHNVAKLTDSDGIKYIFNQCFAQAYREAIYPTYAGANEVGNMNLMLLLQEIRKMYREFIEKVRFLSGFESALEAFLSNASYLVDVQSKDAMNCMRKIRSMMFDEREALYDSGEFISLLREGVDLIDDYSRKRSEGIKNDTSGSDESPYLAKLLKHLAEDFLYDDEGIRSFMKECRAVLRFYSLFYRKLHDCFENGMTESNVRWFFSYFFKEYNYLTEEEENAKFRRYISAHIFNSLEKNLDLLEQNIALYREVTSDLYMVKVLELSPFGYINFFISKISMETELPETYLKRFCRVLYALKGERVESDDTSETWDDVFRNIFSGICGFLCQISDKNISAVEHAGKTQTGAVFTEIKNRFSALQGAAVDCQKKLKLKKEKREFVIDKCYDLTGDYLIPLWESTAGAIQFLSGEGSVNAVGAGMRELREAFGDIKHGVFLCRAFVQIVEEFLEQKAEIERYPFLTEDLFYGATYLEKISSEFRENSLKTFYCSKVAFEYNEPEAGVGFGALKSYRPIWQVDFIMEMYYSMIWHYASKVLNDAVSDR